MTLERAPYFSFATGVSSSPIMAMYKSGKSTLLFDALTANISYDMCATFLVTLTTNRQLQLLCAILVHTGDSMHSYHWRTTSLSTNDGKVYLRCFLRAFLCSENPFGAFYKAAFRDQIALLSTFAARKQNAYYI